jgi:hypothetical protein
MTNTGLLPTRDEFANAGPFPHVVIDGLWNDDWLRGIVDEFPDPADPRWQTYGMEQERGKKAGARPLWGPETVKWFDAMAGPEWCAWIATLLGVPSVVPDDIGGGQHLSAEDARLGIHVDFNQHPTLPLDRRMNVLLFLNPEWRSEWGGDLLLANGPNDDDPLRISPAWNRTVLFATSESSWHGHPEPIVGDHVRRSLACYYFAEPVGPREAAHTTVYAQ